MAVGLATLLDWGAGTAFGTDILYGRPPIELRFLHRSEQRHDEALIGGLTFTIFGSMFWAAHPWGRARAAGAAERGSALRRAYGVLGTFVFGIATIVLVPVGTYVVLSATPLPARTDAYRQGIADVLSGGLVALPIWLVYLRRLVRDVAAAAPVSPARSATPSPGRARA